MKKELQYSEQKLKEQNIRQYESEKNERLLTKKINDL
jgi:hypothetical protein